MNQSENLAGNLAKLPAIGLIVVGALNALTGLLWIAGVVLRATGTLAELPMAQLGEEGAPIRMGQTLIQAIYFFTLVASPFIIIGAVNMLKGRKYSSAKMAAILAMIPATSCCFILGIPFGVWALIVLSKPEVKAFFESGGSNFQPPPPPPQYQ
jgi:hypothetical protein